MSVSKLPLHNPQTALWGAVHKKKLEAI